MSSITVSVEIISDAETMEDVRASGVLQGQARFIERRDLAGDPTTWITLATAGVNLAAAVIKLLLERHAQKGVRKIKIGAVEIENPSKEDLELLARRLHAVTESDAAR